MNFLMKNMINVCDAFLEHQLSYSITERKNVLELSFTDWNGIWNMHPSFYSLVLHY